MIRNLKALGLALVAMFAMSAMAASAASAAEFTSGSYPQTLKTVDSGEEDLFTVSGNELTCSEEEFTGELKAATTALTVTPDYKGCKTKGQTFNNVTVTTNDCTYSFHATTKNGINHHSGKVTIVCPIGKVIEIHHYTTAHNHSTGSSNCTNTVAGQTAGGTVTYTNVGGDVIIEGTVTVNAVLHGQCSFGLTVNATSEYHTSTTAEAASGAAIHVG